MRLLLIVVGSCWNGENAPLGKLRIQILAGWVFSCLVCSCVATYSAKEPDVIAGEIAKDAVPKGFRISYSIKLAETDKKLVNLPKDTYALLSKASRSVLKKIFF